MTAARTSRAAPGSGHHARPTTGGWASSPPGLDDLDGDLQRLAHGEVSPLGAMTCATWESSKPTTATSRPGQAEPCCAGVEHPGQRVRRRRRPRAAPRSSSALRSPRGRRPRCPPRGGETGGGQATSVQGAAPPERRSSPMKESLPSRSTRSACGRGRGGGWSPGRCRPLRRRRPRDGRPTGCPTADRTRRTAPALQPGRLRVAGWVSVTTNASTAVDRSRSSCPAIGSRGSPAKKGRGSRPRARSRPASARSGPWWRSRCPPAPGRCASRSGARARVRRLRAARLGEVAEVVDGLRDPGQGVGAAGRGC